MDCDFWTARNATQTGTETGNGHGRGGGVAMACVVQVVEVGGGPPGATRGLRAAVDAAGIPWAP
jgi:hypothetical protein